MSQQIQPSYTEIKLAEMVKNLNYKQTTYCYINPLGFITKDHAYCALGAMAKTLGLPNSNILLFPERVKSTIEKELKMTDEDKEQWYKCPMCKEKRRLLAMIPHFNDTHKLDFKTISEKITILHKYRLDKTKNPNFKEFLRTWTRRALGN